MSEVKINAYGLLELSRKQYLTIQTVVFLVVGLVLFVSWKYDFAASEELFIKYIGRVFLVVLVLELGELVYMLNLFRRKSLRRESELY